MSDYTEDALIEQPAIALFAQMGWQTANCYDETFGDGKGVLAERLYLGRETSAEVVLVPRSPRRAGKTQPRWLAPMQSLPRLKN